MKAQNDVIVFLETFGENSGTINRGLLTEGYRLSLLLESNLSALFLGNLEPDLGTLAAHGVSKLYHVTGAGLAEYSCETFVWAATTLLKDIPFRILLFAHSDMGSEVSACIAPHLGTVAVLDCFDIRVREGRLIYVKSVYAGQFEQEISFSKDTLEIASIGSNLLDIREAPSATTPVTVKTAVTIPPAVIKTKHLEWLPPDAKTVDIVYSERIIGVGYGCMEPGLLSLAQELSELLESSIGATRPMVDEGVLPRVRMIGQTGKAVSPDLYLALGISGSPHHMSGIQQSKKILAVNQDPRAPIFNFSDAGYVANLKTLLPKLIDRIKQYQSGNPA